MTAPSETPEPSERDRALAEEIWDMVLTHYDHCQSSEMQGFVAEIIAKRRGEDSSQIRGAISKIHEHFGLKHITDLEGLIEKVIYADKLSTSKLNMLLNTRGLQWTADLERERDRLRSALERLRDSDFVITPHDRMDAVRQIAREALVGAGSD